MTAPAAPSRPPSAACEEPFGPMSDQATIISPGRLRFRRFRRLRRGWYSFLLLVGAYVASFFLPFLVNDRAIAVRHDGNWRFPAFANYLHDTLGIGTETIVAASELGQTDEDGRHLLGEADYRKLRAADRPGDVVILPPIPYDPNENFLGQEGSPPYPPSRSHWLGTDDRGRDMLARLAYGFRTSITFALLVTFLSFSVGTVVGGCLGYFGRWVDILGLRLVEIWGAIPFLYTVIILAAVVGKSFWLLVLILSGFGWMGICYYVRGEFYREKSKDYVAAAVATGEGDAGIILSQILPNALTPIVTFAPFAVVAEISALVSLDFLGFGLPEPTPSWGELLRQAKEINFREWHMVVFPLGALFVTLQLVVFIGEAVREAFDPKVFSRLR